MATSGDIGNHHRKSSRDDLLLMDCGACAPVWRRTIRHFENRRGVGPGDEVVFGTTFQPSLATVPKCDGRDLGSTSLKMAVGSTPSSETQGLLVGTMRCFRAIDIFGAKVYFKGWRAPGHFFLPNEFQKCRNPSRRLARKIFFWPINVEI